MKNDRTQVQRIQEELGFIGRILTNVDRESFLQDEVLQHALTMSLITIGECANHLSDSFKDAHPEIEWLQIIGVRNIAAHGYWQLNMEQIWQATVSDIPNLKRFMDRILG